MKKHKLYSILIIFIFIELLFIGYARFDINRELETLYSSKISTLKAQYNSALLSYENIITNTFYQYINKEDIIKIFNDGLHEKDILIKNELRSKLAEKVADTYELLKTIGIRQLHFHDRDNRSYLRMHRPEKYGDDLTDIRFSIREANKKNITVNGFEEGRIFNGFRYVFPVEYNKIHIGTVELSIGSNVIQEFMNNIYPDYYYFIIDEKVVNKKVFSSEKLNYDKSFVSSDFLHEKIFTPMTDKKLNQIANPETFLKINKLIQTETKKHILKYKPFTLNCSLDNSHYIISFLPVKNAEGHYVAYFISYEKDDSVNEINNNLYFKTGTATVILILFFYIYYKSEKLRYISNNMNSVLEAKVKNQVKTLRSHEQLIAQQSKMATMGEMLRSVAHQWKQSLNVISIISQTIEDDLTSEEFDKDELIEQSQTIFNQTAFMNKTITDFQNFMKPTYHKEIFNLEDNINHLIELFGFQFKYWNISLELKVNSDKQMIVCGYPNEFMHVILNLIGNAKDAIIEKKQKLQTSNLLDISNDSIVISMECINNSLVKVTVTDTGGGIPQELIDNIFNAYVSSKGEKGTGIGLFMAKNIIEEHMNGSLFVSNTECGAEFTIVLDLYNEEGEQIS